METTAIETSSAGPEGAVQPQEQQALMPESKSKQMKVMVAIDDSDVSFYALNWVLDNLLKCAELNQEWGMVTVAHIHQPFKPIVFPPGPGAEVGINPWAADEFIETEASVAYDTSIQVESIRKAQEEDVAAIVSRALEMCKEKMIKAEALILEGDPKDMICQATDQMHVDLLVVGSRGLGKIKRAFLGSVSDYCAHHANCPVLIVKPPKESH